MILLSARSARTVSKSSRWTAGSTCDTKGLLAKIRNIPERIWGSRNRPSEVEKIRAVAPFLKLQPLPEVCRVVDIALAIRDPRSQAIATSLVAATTIDILPSQTQAQLIENALGHVRSAELVLNTNAGQERALAAAKTIGWPRIICNQSNSPRRLYIAPQTRAWPIDQRRS
jgi:hypothetical protein